MKTTPYIWQQQQWSDLIQAFKQSHLSHALLFTGASQIGKFDFAQAITTALLCENLSAEYLPCRQCQSCQLLKVGNHPDYQLIQSDPKLALKTIKIEQIRDLSAWLPISSQVTNNRVVIIRNAEEMNNASANALLKTLEEPVSNRYIILTSSQPDQLLATIRSRCQQTFFGKAGKQTAKIWLKKHALINEKDIPLLLSLSQYSPLKALKLAEKDNFNLRKTYFKHFFELIKGREDPVLSAAKWLKNKDLPYHEWLLIWVMDLIRTHYKIEKNSLYQPDTEKNLQLLLDDINLRRLYQLYDDLLQMQTLWQPTVNKQLLLEKVLIKSTTLRTRMK